MSYTQKNVTICFTDRHTGQDAFVDMINASAYFTNNKFDASKYTVSFPDRMVRKVFYNNNNILLNEDIERDKFNLYCRDYGFKPENYLAEFTDVNNGISEDYIFVGFNPNNRKYKCLLYSKNRKTGIKATVNFVKKYILQS